MIRKNFVGSRKAFVPLELRLKLGRYTASAPSRNALYLSDKSLKRLRLWSVETKIVTRMG